MWLLILQFIIRHPIVSLTSLYYSYQSDRWFKKQLGEMFYGNGSYAYLRWKHYKSKSDKWNAKAEPLVEKYMK